MDERTTSSWKEAGEVWNAVSSRIVTAWLKASSVGQRRPHDSRETRNTYVLVKSVYVPTAKVPPGVVQKFMEDLQDTVEEIPASDVLIVLGDFNARLAEV